MSDYLIQKETITGIADAVRSKTGSTDKMVPSKIITEIGKLADVSNDTVTADKMLGGITAHDKTGEKIEGTILTSLAGGTYTPGKTDRTLNVAKQYMLLPITIKGDANLVPENIKSGVSIFGVEGTVEAGGGSVSMISFITYSGSSISTSTAKPQLAEAGMTWGDWISSAYNVDGFRASGTTVIHPNNRTLTNVTTNALISNRMIYGFIEAAPK